MDSSFFIMKSQFIQEIFFIFANPDKMFHAFYVFLLNEKQNTICDDETPVS